MIPAIVVNLSYLVVCNDQTDRQRDVVQYIETLSSDQLYQRHTCSLSLADAEDCYQTCHTPRQYHL